MKTRQNKFLSTVIVAVFLCALLLGHAPDAAAVGTPAGTTIANQARVVYDAGGTNYVALSNVNVIRVSEVLHMAATWLDTPPGVTVNPGQAAAITTFRVTNTGNGNDQYVLAATGTGISGDQFDPAVTTLYLDANANGTYDAGTDALYTSGTGTLAADSFVTVFVLSSIPTTSIASGDRGNVQLTARSRTGTGSPGASLPGLGEGGFDAVIGPSGGVQSVIGVYVASSASVAMIKSVEVFDQSGGSLPIPGATLRYAITITAAGSASANTVTIRDPLPANTTYRTGTLRLNGTLLTDAADADAGDVGGTTANTVTVQLGAMTSASPAQTITFDAKIN